MRSKYHQVKKCKIFIAILLFWSQYIFFQIIVIIIQQISQAQKSSVGDHHDEFNSFWVLEHFIDFKEKLNCIFFALSDNGTKVYYTPCIQGLEIILMRHMVSWDLYLYQLLISRYIQMFCIPFDENTLYSISTKLYRIY